MKIPVQKKHFELKNGYYYKSVAKNSVNRDILFIVQLQFSLHALSLNFKHISLNSTPIDVCIES